MSALWKYLTSRILNKESQHQYFATYTFVEILVFHCQTRTSHVFSTRNDVSVIHSNQIPRENPIIIVGKGKPTHGKRVQIEPFMYEERVQPASRFFPSCTICRHTR